MKILTVLLLIIMLYSCQQNNARETLTNNSSIIFKPQTLNSIDTSKVYICGTAMANKLDEEMKQNFDHSFEPFWLAFYKDLMNKNYNSLKSKTRFPLQAKGELNYDSIDKYEKEDFKPIFSKFLTEEILEIKQFRYERIKERKGCPYVSNTDSTLRVEDMVFTRIKNDWMLMMIYNGHSK